MVTRGCASVSLWRGFLAVKGFGGRLGGARLDATELAARVVDGKGGWGVVGWRVAMRLGLDGEGVWGVRSGGAWRCAWGWTAKGGMAGRLV